MNGYIDMQKLYDTAGVIFNNTIIGYGGGHGILAAQNISAAGWTVKNNIFMSLQYAEAPANATWLPDYNSLYNNTTAGYNGGFYDTFASWQTALGGCPGTNHDCNSIATNPNLNANYTPKSNSPTVGAGVNLTSLGITALNSDKNGVARPASGAWDMGAYVSTTTKPKAPRNLRITR
jgi:hypothetical protein